jgi:hypothetical protein
MLDWLKTLPNIFFWTRCRHSKASYRYVERIMPEFLRMDMIIGLHGYRFGTEVTM